MGGVRCVLCLGRRDMYKNYLHGRRRSQAVAGGEHPPPPCAPPRLGRRGPHVRFEPASPLLHYTGSAGRQESGGAPHCPERPPPH